MCEYEIIVKPYMTKKSTPEFNFMAQWNNDIPMPLVTMTGKEIKETKGMVYMQLHGDIHTTSVTRCMKCGKPITNKISQFFGLGPECGHHHYTNPFSSQEELNEAVESYKKEYLQKLTWEGWIIKSAIISKKAIGEIEDTPIEEVIPKKSITLTIDKPNKLNVVDSVFAKFDYDGDLLSFIRSLPFRAWDGENKQWEIAMESYSSLLNTLEKLNYESTIIDNRPKEVKESTLPTLVDFDFKTKPFKHQIEGVEYGLNHARWLLADEQGLGKTKQIIDIAVSRKKSQNLKHCLIICGVNGLKWNWVKEIETHSNEHGYILGQRAKKNKIVIGSTKDKLDDVINIKDNPNFFIITNVETLRDANITKELQKACKNGIIDMVACDEAHKCFDYDTLVTTNKGDIKIGDIVTNKLEVKVKSYNENTQEVEWKNIVGWFENPIGEKLMELEIETSKGIKTIRCTDTHKFLTNRGWICAKDLTEEDELFELDNL